MLFALQQHHTGHQVGRLFQPWDPPLHHSRYFGRVWNWEGGSVSARLHKSSISADNFLEEQEDQKGLKAFSVW